ncbi:MAG: AMP-binding protein [Deltaproteobacteria bacterium]|nr:AMP-binding protein [Deltaproteobacteria bacterium]
MSELTFLSDLYELRAQEKGDKPYIFYEDYTVSFAEFYQGTCRAANGLAAQGASPGDGIALMMGNCPEYLFVINGTPRGGFYSVPINTAMKGESLKYVLTDSDVKYLLVDDTFYPRIEELGSPLGAIQKIFVRRTTDAPLPSGTIELEALLDASPEKPSHTQKMGDMTIIIYTSGTTGMPKGVVTRGVPGSPQRVQLLASIWARPDDILYTCLPLFHGNALNLTAAPAMGAGVPFGLEKKFSASKFWEPIRRWGVTTFNALGAMIPILMKQPEKPDDADNPVRLVFSAACPANLWVAFEKRFNVEIYEGYAAVDGGGVFIMNRGDAPVGSVGKFPPVVEWKLVDDDGNEVPQGEVGELINKVPEDRKGRVVEYYKNPEASEEKVKGGWIRSGDLFYADQEGNLFFVDRKTDSMRRRGENISSWEVENVVEKHPHVAESAAFGVPSELGEDEVMIHVVPKAGAKLDLKNLINFCVENMPYFMVPRYIDVTDEVPRTQTHRVLKGDMKKRGVTERTWDREKEMPDLKLKR